MTLSEHDQIRAFFNSFPYSICPTCNRTTRYLTPPEKAICVTCGPIPCVCCGDQAVVTSDTTMAADLCNRCRREHGG